MAKFLDIDISLRGDPEKWVRTLIPSIRKGAEFGMFKAAQYARGEVQRQISGGFKSGRGGLARSYVATILKPTKKGELRAGAVSSLVYAKIQNEGGRVTAKAARALTIPLTHEARRASQVGRTAREFPTPLALIWPKGKSTGWLVEKQRRKSIMHYLLTRSVKIPGTRYLEKARDAAEEQILDIVGTSVTVEAGKAKAGGE